MPLFHLPRAKSRPRQRAFMKKKLMPSSWRTDDDGSVVPLARLCLLSIAQNVKSVWVKDYADNYLDQYSFRYIMGPFNCLPSELVEELIWLLSIQKQLTRAALHLLLVPQLRGLFLDKCSSLVTSALCFHISARCEGLWSLDLSGAHQLPSKVLSQTIGTLPNLRSLCLTGTLCDGGVVRTIALCCRSLRHLDISRCHLIPPSALFHLGHAPPLPSPGGHLSDSSPSQGSCSSPLSLPSLRSLYALDIGFGDEEGAAVAAAAYLLLTLPVLEKVALDGVSQACHLIQCREFDQANKFTEREGLPRLADLFWERICVQKNGKGASRGPVAGEEDEETLWEGSSGDEGTGCPREEEWKQSKKRVVSQPDDECVTLCLKEVKSLSCDSLNSLGPLCPNLCSISVNIGNDEDDRERGQGSLLAEFLQTWCGQLCCLSVQYLGYMIDVFSAVEVVGSSLLSLTLEGVKSSPHTPLLKLIKGCPRLKELHIIGESPHSMAHEDQEENELDDLPRLPNLRSLSLKFSFKQCQRPVKTWSSLKQVIECLLAGSLLLEKISLWSLPCDLNIILDQSLPRRPRLPSLPSSSDIPLMPLAQALYIEFPWTDVQGSTVSRLMQQCKRLQYLDVSNCWGITQKDYSSWRMYKRVTVVWC